jgi:hypothetical protein
MATGRACLGDDVLRPRFLRDTLLGLADFNAALFSPVWSRGTLDRLEKSLASSSGIGPGVARRIVQHLQAGWPAAEARPEPGLLAALERQIGPDAELLAVAVAAGADSLVTGHPGDFPDAICAPLHVVSLSAEQFLREVFFGNRDDCIQLLARLVAGYTERISFRDLLGGLLVDGLEEFVFDLVGFRPIIELEALTDEWRRVVQDDI